MKSEKLKKTKKDKSVRLSAAEEISDLRDSIRLLLARAIRERVGSNWLARTKLPWCGVTEAEVDECIDSIRQLKKWHTKESWLSAKSWISL